MNVSIQDKSSFQKELEVTLSPAEMELYVERAAQALGAQLSLNRKSSGKRF